MSLVDKTRDRIRELNDAFRTTLDPTLGRIMLTTGVSSLSPNIRDQIIQNTAAFNAFSPDNDPHGEHDFGKFEIGGQRFYFKIDYYDRNIEYGSDDPSDPSKTTRVLTLMLAEEY